MVAAKDECQSVLKEVSLRAKGEEKLRRICQIRLQVSCNVFICQTFKPPMTQELDLVTRKFYHETTGSRE